MRYRSGGFWIPCSVTLCCVFLKIIRWFWHLSPSLDPKWTALWHIYVLNSLSLRNVTEGNFGWICCLKRWENNTVSLSYDHLIEIEHRIFQTFCFPCVTFSSPNCYCLVCQLCLSPSNPMVCSTLGFPVHHQLPELAQTHLHWVSDVIQPSHPLSSPSPAFYLSQP